MNILLVTPNFVPDVGGVETMLDGLCGHLAFQKHNVNVVTYNSLFVKEKRPFREKVNEYVTVWRIRWIGRGLFNVFEHYPIVQFFYLVPALAFSTLVFLLLKKEKPEIIHAFGLSGAFSGGLASRIFNIPCVADMCTVYRLPKRPWLAFFAKKILEWSDYVRANNSVGREELLKVGLHQERVGIISPPIDEEVFKPIPQDEARLRIGLKTKGFVSLFVGRMVAGKNVELAVAATRLIRDPSVSFVFVGEGPLQDLVEEAAKEDDRIIYVGNVLHENLPFYYNAADVLMCAAVDKDLIAFVGREALMCGLPILASKVAVYFGIPYIISTDLLPAEVGRIFEPTSDDLASRINEFTQIKGKESDYTSYRAKCREYAIGKFSYQAINWINGAYAQAVSLHFPVEEKQMI